MRTPFRQLLALAFAASAACGRSSPPTPSPGTMMPESIRGTERIGWDQAAADAAELGRFKYAIYVDGARSEMADASCGGTAAAAGFACSGRLPPMPLGAHTLELATFIDDDGIRESPRSTPLRVIVTAISTALDPARSADASASSRKIPGRATDRVASAVRRKIPAIVMTSDGVRLRLEILAENLDAPSDLAFADNGFLFIAERAGAIRIFRDGRAGGGPALARDDVRETGEQLLGLSVDPRFERTGFVYALQAVGAEINTRSFRLIRYREVNGVLGDRAVLFDNMAPASADPSAVLRFGPDRKLYAALDDGGDVGRGEDLSSFGGKILRLNQDGSTPADQPGATPILSHAYPSPRGVDWHPATGLLWIATRDHTGHERVRVSRDVSYALPSAADVSAIAFYRGDLIREFRNDLLIAARQGYLLRLRFDPDHPHRIVATERLLDGIGGLTALAVGPDGAIYLCAEGMLIRLIP